MWFMLIYCLKCVPLAHCLTDRVNIMFPFFPLTFVVPVLLGLHPGSIVWNRCLLLILIYLSPPQCTRSKSVYRACAGGRVCVCVCVSYCVCVLHVLRWCQLYSVSKDRCAEDRLCQEHRRSEETLWNTVLNQSLLSLHLHMRSLECGGF